MTNHHQPRSLPMLARKCLGILAIDTKAHHMPRSSVGQRDVPIIFLFKGIIREAIETDSDFLLTPVQRCHHLMSGSVSARNRTSLGEKLSLWGAWSSWKPPAATQRLLPWICWFDSIVHNWCTSFKIPGFPSKNAHFGVMGVTYHYGYTHWKSRISFPRTELEHPTVEVDIFTLCRRHISPCRLPQKPTPSDRRWQLTARNLL